MSPLLHPVAFARPSCAALLIAAIAGHAPALRAQCADGSAPPCQSAVQRVAARETRRPPDPNRIAILPFRVTTTDTLLGEGFAELLATEFTGEGAPRAVDMATVLSAWRRAGGGLRTPLPRARALEVARELGAGIVSEGSIVGLGRQITVTTTLISVTDGTPRGNPTRVSAPADSLDAALRQAATGLLATVGGQQRSIEGARYTESPEAMRLYLLGLSAWRRGRISDAGRDFERAIALDSSFAQAIFRRYLVGVWSLGGGVYQQLAWDRRSRLSPNERMVLEGILGSGHPAARSLAQRHADRERVAVRLPDSPDALYFAGDHWYHYAAPIDPVNQLARARDYLTRAADIDSQATVLRHLIEVGVRLRDTALLRRVTPAYLRTEDAGTWAGAWVAAASIGDAPMLAQLRRQGPKGPSSTWPIGTALVADIPGVLLNELFTRWEASESAAGRDRIGEARAYVLATRGRPAAAESLWSSVPAERALGIHRNRLVLGLADAATGLNVAASVQRLSGALTDTGRITNDACLVVLWRMKQADTSAIDLARSDQQSSPCRLAIAVLRAQRGPATARETLERADSTLHEQTNVGLSGFEAYLLAQAWERLGEPKRALTAIRYRALGLGSAEAPWTLPYEGKLAAIVGDTVGAVRAYRYWLEISADAEPILQPKRDSVRAEVARLTRKPTS